MVLILFTVQFYNDMVGTRNESLAILKQYFKLDPKPTEAAWRIEKERGNEIRYYFISSLFFYAVPKW